MGKKKKNVRSAELPADAGIRRPFNFRKAGILLLWIVGAAGVYFLCNSFELSFHLYAYPIVIGVLAGAFVLLNGGFSRELPSESDLPEGWDPMKKREYLEKAKKNKETAKKLLYPLIGMLTAVLLDLLILNIGEMTWL